MKTPDTIKIEFEFECNQDFSKMKKTPCGRFCEICKKEVFDLTNKSHKEIKKLSDSLNGDMCGVFLPEQIESDLIPISKLIPAPSKSWMAAVFTILGVGLTNINAQSCDKHPMEQVESEKQEEKLTRADRKEKRKRKIRRKLRRRHDGWNYVDSYGWEYYITYKWPFFYRKPVHRGGLPTFR